MVEESVEKGDDGGKGSDMYEDEVRDLRGGEVDVPRWITTRMYSWPWAERTGKRPVRLAEDHWSLWRVTEALGKAMLASRQEWRDSRERQVEEETRRVEAIP